MRGWIVGGVASAALLLVQSVQAVEPAALLTAMTDAAREQSYQGDFIYERTGIFSTHRVWRQAGEPIVERLLRTDGVPQEWVRRDGRLQCTSALTADSAWRDSGMSAVQPSQLDQWYSLSVLGVTRVANRAATVVAVEPRDALRYAHELYLDVDSGLLLQSLLVNEQGTLLERFQFTNVELGPVAAEQLSAGSLCQPVSKPPANRVADERWLPAWVPAGFAAVRREMRSLNGDPEAVFAQVFTDGLARFTVFIEPLPEDRTVDDLRAQLGPTVAVSRELLLPEGRYLATVVGEVPPRVAEQVAASLSPDFESDALTKSAP
ncbi:MAG: MucB/RseB C-terminal domain-containing protein [Halopseudomonas sp.]